MRVRGGVGVRVRVGGAHCPVGPACVSPHIQNRPHPSTTCAPRPLPLPAWHSFSATHCARADARGVFVVGGTTKGDWGGCGVTGEGVGRGGCGVVCARHSVVCRRGVEPSRLPVRHRRLHMGGVAVHGHPSPPHRPRRRVVPLRPRPVNARSVGTRSCSFGI